jgi:hypothetical protein
MCNYRAGPRICNLLFREAATASRTGEVGSTSGLATGEPHPCRAAFAASSTRFSAARFLADSAGVVLFGLIIREAADQGRGGVVWESATVWDRFRGDTTEASCGRAWESEDDFGRVVGDLLASVCFLADFGEVIAMARALKDAISRRRPRT